MDSKNFRRERRINMESGLLEALEVSDPAGASQSLIEELKKGTDPWEVHLTLYPVVQRVLNPPFINPHLPKMYRICREFVPFLNGDEIRKLLSLEVNEYAKRPKLDKLPGANLLTSPVSFNDVERAIHEKNWEKTTVFMATFHAQQGGAELARQLLLLGSGYLDDSLGHSVSCSAFILLEMLERPEDDPWPALATLSDYFCRGEFDTRPGLSRSGLPSGEALNRLMLRATCGQGIVNLHHTITRYALDRVKHLFTPEEFDHMLSAWNEFMGKKRVVEVVLDTADGEREDGYPVFYELFSKLEPKATTASLRKGLPAPQGRQQLSHFLIRGVCDLYQNNYNPHYLTGLGSALWVAGRYWNVVPIATNALFQYLDFFFRGLKSDD
jgi:hypothetical protein